MCLQIYKAIKLLTHYWWNSKMGIVTLENSFQFLKKLNTHLLSHLWGSVNTELTLFILCISPRESSLSHGQNLAMESLESFLYVRYWWFCYILLQQQTLSTSWSNHFAETSRLTVWTQVSPAAAGCMSGYTYVTRSPYKSQILRLKWASLDRNIPHILLCFTAREKARPVCSTRQDQEAYVVTP